MSSTVPRPFRSWIPRPGLGVVTGSLESTWPASLAANGEMVDGLIELHLANFKASGAELVMGEARFTEPKTVQVT